MCSITLDNVEALARVEINGHYYMSSQEISDKMNSFNGWLWQEYWEYTLENLGFDAVPTYLIYDRNGVLKHQVTGYPGNEKMQAMLEALLP